MHLLLSFAGVFIGFFLAWNVGIIKLGFINLFSATALWFTPLILKEQTLAATY